VAVPFLDKRELTIGDGSLAQKQSSEDAQAIKKLPLDFVRCDFFERLVERGLANVV
jgi:hypothetical protein